MPEGLFAFLAVKGAYLEGAVLFNGSSQVTDLSVKLYAAGSLVKTHSYSLDYFSGGKSAFDLSNRAVFKCKLYHFSFSFASKYFFKSFQTETGGMPLLENILFFNHRSKHPLLMYEFSEMIYILLLEAVLQAVQTAFPDILLLSSRRKAPRFQDISLLGKAYRPM